MTLGAWMRRGVRWVRAVSLLAVVLPGVAACSASSPSEQIVQSNLPSERPALSEARSLEARSTAAPKVAAERTSNGKKAITSQQVEKELNRLEAELAR